MTLLNMSHCCKTQEDSLRAMVSVHSGEYGGGMQGASQYKMNHPAVLPNWYCHFLYCVTVTFTNVLKNCPVPQSLPWNIQISSKTKPAEVSQMCYSVNATDSTDETVPSTLLWGSPTDCCVEMPLAMQI